MKESLLATFLFWSAFMFSIGPWWIAFMEEAKDAPFSHLFGNLAILMCTGWPLFIFFTSAIIYWLGGINLWILVALHFIGGAFILYLSYKTLAAKIQRGKKINFDWRAMSLLVWINPKAWIFIPAGSLAANYSSSFAINIIGFYLMSVPLYFGGAFVWAIVAKQGEKWSVGKISYINALLLAAFAIYLFWQGGNLAIT